MKRYTFAFGFFFVFVLGTYFFTFSQTVTDPLLAAKTTQSKTHVTYEYQTIPVLKKDAYMPIVSAQTVLAYDVASGRSLFEKLPDKPMLPASTTKILTAMTALEVYNPEDVLTVEPYSVEGQKMNLAIGEKLKIKDLLYGLLVYSANDAAEVLANQSSLGRDGFIEKMNEKARIMGLKNTSFSNPSGLDSSNHVSTARDLAYLAVEAMKNPLISEIVGTKEIVIKSTDGVYQHRLRNINELIGEVDGVLGIKTGWTENAKENLVTYVRRDGRDVVVVVLASQDRFGDTKTLIEWIYQNYLWQGVSMPFSG